MRRLMRPVVGIEEPQINVTPLIDVVFVILILFILIAPLLESESIELAPAAASTRRQVEEASMIQIKVTQEEKIWVQSQQIPLEHLASHLMTLRKENPQAKPQILPDQHISFGCFQNVKKALETAGFRQADVIVAP